VSVRTAVPFTLVALRTVVLFTLLGFLLSLPMAGLHWMFILYVGGGSLGVLLTAYLWLYEDQRSLNHLVFLFLTCVTAFPIALVSMIPGVLLIQLWLGRQFEDPWAFSIQLFCAGAVGALLVSGALLKSHPRRSGWSEIAIESLFCAVVVGAISPWRGVSLPL
jgi:hypothetical protein